MRRSRRQTVLSRRYGLPSYTEGMPIVRSLQGVLRRNLIALWDFRLRKWTGDQKLWLDSGRSQILDAIGDPMGSGDELVSGLHAVQTTDADRPMWLGLDGGIGGDGYLVADGWSKSATDGFTVMVVFRNTDVDDDVTFVLETDNPNHSSEATFFRTRGNGQIQVGTRDDDNSSTGASFVDDGDDNRADFSQWGVLTYTLHLEDGDLVERARVNDEPDTHNIETIPDSPGATHDGLTIRARMDGSNVMEGPVRLLVMSRKRFDEPTETAIIRTLMGAL